MPNINLNKKIIDTISYSTAVIVHSRESRHPNLKGFVNASACLLAYFKVFNCTNIYSYRFADSSKYSFRSFFSRLLVCIHYGNDQWILSLCFLICLKKNKNNTYTKRINFLNYFILTDVHNDNCVLKPRPQLAVHVCLPCVCYGFYPSWPPWLFEA